MKVSIILPYYQPPIKGCVESIRQQTYRDIELIQISEKELGLTVRKGAGFMRNEGAKRASGDILFFMDSDATLFPDAIEKLVGLFAETGGDAISTLPIAPKRNETDLLNYLLGLEYEERIRAMGEGWVNVAATTGLGVRRAVFDKVGGFVTEFSRGVGEDWIFSCEMLQRGYKIWHTNKVKLHHYTAESFRKYLAKQAGHAGYRVIHYKRYKKMKDSYTTFLPLNLLLCNVPLSLKLATRTRDPAVLALIPLSLVRNFVWVISAFLVWTRIVKLQNVK
ncbi:MAG: glycosyltransferase [Chloroflexi bacterium]|nr:glycosyltransferase [Chloroflexota bacterium]